MNFRVLVVAAMLLGSSAFAQAIDASLPDGSVGTGTPDPMQEGEGMENSVCSLTVDCSRGFICAKGRCTFSGTRNAGCVGCSSGAAGLAFPILLLWRWRRRRPA